jgi:hypothetical protein
MVTEPRPRQFEGTYQAAMKRMDVHSPVSKIVHEELDEFFQRVRDRLNNLDSHSSTIEVNNEIKSALAFRFGNPVAKACMTLVKGPNTWNGISMTILCENLTSFVKIILVVYISNHHII